MNLSHHFLLAMPSLDNDSVFHQSVVYLCEHGESGALGLIVNKPSPVNMEIVFAAIGKPTPEKLQGQFVMMGCPVGTRFCAAYADGRMGKQPAH